jgi:hypothetical protein
MNMYSCYMSIKWWWSQVNIVKVTQAAFEMIVMFFLYNFKCI